MRYRHTCANCKPLGQYDKYDLYYCAGFEEPVLARFSDKPADYMSAPACIVEAGEGYPLRIAKQRAIDLGVYTGD